MPYFEVGKSRRYADRRVGISVSMIFIAFMLVSNWMGTPEFRVQSSPDREVSVRVLPEEGPSKMLSVPYEEFNAPNTYLPGEEVPGSPFLTEALKRFEEVLFLRSCTLTGNPDYPECIVEELPNGEMRYSNRWFGNVMPDPVAELRVKEIQPDLLELRLYYEAVDPQNPDELLVLSDDWVRYLHRNANYAEECSYVNKNC